MPYRKPHRGFALLLTLIVVSVALAIGLTLLDNTLKQIVISGSSRDSERAFHAAYAGIECGEYYFKQNTVRTALISGTIPSLDTCLGTVAANKTTNSNPAVNVYEANYEIAWNEGSESFCTEIDVFVFDASAGQVTYTSGPFQYYNQNTCPEGAMCTVIFSRGYNRSCSDIGTVRTIQREVVSKF